MNRLTLVLTNDCNQNCSYCYQIKNPARMNFQTAKKAVDYLFMNCTGVPEVSFWGGEPFLMFDLMEQVVEYSTNRFRPSGRIPQFSVTTNGTLLDKERLQYCVDVRMELTLSIDGTEEAHEMGRGKGSFDHVENVLPMYEAFPDFSLCTVSVITPENVIHLFDSVQYLVSKKVDELLLSLQYDCPWNRTDLEMLGHQYKKAFDYLVQYKSNGGKIKFNELRPPSPFKPVFQCNAGDNEIVVTPEGFIYGCSMHIPWSKRALDSNTQHRFEDLCLGHFGRFSTKGLKRKIESLTSNEWLRGQYYHRTSETECRNCEYLFQCAVCPAVSMIYCNDPLRIPDWVCEMNKTLYRIGRDYWKTSESELFS